MNNLPKYWIVKNDDSQLFKNTVIKYLHLIGGSWTGDLNWYYGFDGSSNYKGTNTYFYPDNFQNNPTILSIEEFITLSKEIEEFPEKWFIPITEENHVVLYNWWKEQVSSSFLCYWQGENNSYCVLSIFYDGSYLDYQKEGQNAKMKGCVEITFEQFKKHVLKQTSMETNKKIIGWELKENCKQFEKAIDSIIKSENSFPLFGGETILEINGQKHSIQLLKESGVLELWFTPVYAPSYPQITINSYKGEFFDDYVKFGCAKIDKQLFIDLYKTSKINWSMYGNKNVEAVTIGKGTFYKEQIKEIAEYYLNKK